MREVLISIQPRWVEKIVSGKKTVEVRKTRPKCEIPFKCYIYETKDNRFEDMGYCWSKGEYFEHHIGKVIGEFVCDKIDKIFQCNSGWVQEHACISREEYFKYLGLPYNSHFDSKGAYAWHITDLVVYDKPRELSEFATVCEGLKPHQCDKCVYYFYESTEDGAYDECCCNNLKPLTRPPQSWCYVERSEKGKCQEKQRLSATDADQK